MKIHGDRRLLHWNGRSLWGPKFRAWPLMFACLGICQSIETATAEPTRRDHAAVSAQIDSQLDSAKVTPDSSDVGTPAAPTPDSRPATPDTLTESLRDALPAEWGGWIQPERFAYTAQLVVTMTLLGLIPAVLLMTTSYIRISIVLSLLRQAFGNQLLPMQVTAALAMFCTGLVMLPTWKLVHERAIVPLVEGTQPSDLAELWNHGIQPIRDFMVRQIDAHENSDDVHLFMRHLSAGKDYPSSYEQVPLNALLPAFVLSELKTAFLIGFQIYLPFLVIDLVVATVTTSMGMFMLPPNMVSLPLKLLLFVMVDGWRLIIEMLLSSFQ